ncbi:hypothetical protein C789_3112 [Microcystis aeruginosa FACHB-905 = DIANCHI905]|nr:hypothetical protein C789_3112 [Microcystis aeruginosa FACHB-905 = DIANCHI905]
MIQDCLLSRSLPTPQKENSSSRFCVISLTYYMIDQSLCPLCLCGSFHPLALENVS